MIAESTIRDALDCPDAETVAQRVQQLQAAEHRAVAIRICTVAEANLHRARQAGDTRAIHTAEQVYKAAKTHLLAVETGRAA